MGRNADPSLNGQDDIYKSAPSPVILEERSDEESQTEPLPLLLVARRPTRQGLVPARRRKNARRFYFRLPDSGDPMGAAQHAKRIPANLCGR
jgi:hypothetical protein